MPAVCAVPGEVSLLLPLTSVASHPCRSARYISVYLRADAAEASRYRIELYTCGGRAPYAPLATADLVHAFGFAREFVGVRRFCLRDEILAASDEIFVVASRAPALCAVPNSTGDAPDVFGMFS